MHDQMEQPEAITKTPGENRTKTGLITVRLGGAPEYGDPHYRLMVNKRQIANGNVDWSMGLPALGAETPESLVCWQDVTLEWDFEDGLPDQVSITYDTDLTGQFAKQCLLTVDWIEVDGLKIYASSDYAYVDGKRISWPEDDQIWSWAGTLIFDIPAAAGGVPPRGQPDHAPGNESRKDDLSQSDDDKKPLVITVQDYDLENPAVMAELEALRSYVVGRDTPALDMDRIKQFTRLGLEKGPWSDVVFVDEAGNNVQIGGAEPTGARFDDVDVTDIDAHKVQTFSVADGDLIKRQFIDGVVTRATDRLSPSEDHHQDKDQRSSSPSKELEAPVPQLIPTSRREGQKRVKDFYGHILKKALDKLQESIKVQPTDSSDLVDGSAQNQHAARGGSSGELRSYGEEIKRQFYEAALAKAKSLSEREAII